MIAMTRRHSVKRAIAAATLLAMAFPSVTMSAAQKSTRARPNGPPAGPAYASSITGVDCSNIVERARDLKPLLPLLRSAALKGGLQVERDEFETSETRSARQAAKLEQLLGGTRRIVAAIPLESYNFTYHADAGEMSAGGPFNEDLYHVGRDYSNRQVDLQLFRETLTTETYDASNAYGASTEVERSNKLRMALLLGKGAVQKMPRLKLDVSHAKALKASPRLLIVGELRAPFVSFSYERISPATIDYPYETRLASYGLHTKINCAVLTGGGEEFYRWTF